MASKSGGSPVLDRVVETGTEARELERAPLHLMDLGEASVAVASGESPANVTWEGTTND
jgi:hypothetical protein